MKQEINVKCGGRTRFISHKEIICRQNIPFSHDPDYNPKEEKSVKGAILAARHSNNGVLLPHLLVKQVQFRGATETPRETGLARSSGPKL